MNDEDQLDGEVSRALTLGGLTFATQLAGDAELPRTVRIYNVPFQNPSADGGAFSVVAYVSRPFFVVTCGLRLAGNASLERLSETVYRLVPMARLVKPASVGPLETKVEDGTFWVEATSIVHPGPWSADAHVLVAIPIQVVSNAVRLLLTGFPSEVQLSAAPAPFMEISLAPAAAKAG